MGFMKENRKFSGFFFQNIKRVLEVCKADCFPESSRRDISIPEHKYAFYCLLPTRSLTKGLGIHSLSPGCRGVSPGGGQKADRGFSLRWDIGKKCRS